MDILLQLSPVLVPLVVAAVALLYRLTLSTLPDAQRTRVKEIVERVVTAVEQTYELSPGPDKRQAALTTLSQLLQHHGLEVDPVELGTLLEAAVYDLNQSQMKWPTTKVPTIPKSTS